MRLYINRAIGGDCRHYTVGGAIAAGTPADQETGKGSYVSIQSETMGPWTKAGGVKQDDRPEWMRHFNEY